MECALEGVEGGNLDDTNRQNPEVCQRQTDTEFDGFGWGEFPTPSPTKAPTFPAPSVSPSHATDSPTVPTDAPT